MTEESSGDSSPVVVANFFMYLGLLMAVGLAVFLAFVHDGGRDRRTLKRWLALFAVVGWAGVLTMVILRTLEATGGQLMGAGVPPGGPASLALVTVGAPLMALASWRGSRAMVIAGAVLVLVSLVVVGHTRSSEPVWLMMTSDLLHVAGGAIWVGGLAGLAAVTWGRRGIPGGSPPDPASASTMVTRFSSIGVWALAVVALSGLTMAWLTVPSWNSLVGTTYGRLALTKMGMFVVVAVVAAVNRYRFKPRLQTSEGSPALSRIRITTTVECAALILILGVAALLVEQDPSQGPGAPLGSQGTVQFALGDFTATLEFEPGATGANQVGLLIRDETGSPITLPEAPALSLSQPESASGPLRYQLVEGGSGYTGEVTIPSAGIWQFIISARVDTFEQATAILRLDTSTRHFSPESGLIVSKARMPTPLVGSAAVYMTLESDEDDRLVAATSPACHHTELHESVIDEFGVATMHLRPSILLTAGQPLELTSGSYHIMCEHADINLTVGDTTVFMVEMASGRRLRVLVDVVSYAELEGGLD
jgi:copper transport protein